MSEPTAPREPLPIGRSATVEVPATSANLGPGFDSLGMALDWRDTFSVEVIPERLRFDLRGEGSDQLPRSGNHLVVRTILETLAEWNLQAPGLHYQANSSIPLTRGLGSSSAAIVGGLLLAWELARPGELLDREWAFEKAYALEGHGDNVGPAIMGGFTITWTGSKTKASYIKSSAIRDDVRALVLIPPAELSTDSARAALPAMVPIPDAVANSARSALLVHALADEPELLLEATADRLHQDYRSSLAPPSYALMQQLRARGHAAVISGAGPTVLVLHKQDQTDGLLADVTQIPEAQPMTVRVLRPGRGARII